MCPSTLKALRARSKQFKTTIDGLRTPEVKTAILVQKWRLTDPRTHASNFTAPFDPRFASTQDKTKHCWSLFNEFLRCIKQKGDANPKCLQLQRWAHGVCPSEMEKAWIEQRAAGNFGGYQVDWQPKEPEPEDEEETPASGGEEGSAEDSSAPAEGEAKSEESEVHTDDDHHDAAAHEEEKAPAAEEKASSAAAPKKAKKSKEIFKQSQTIEKIKERK